ncbi:MAG: type II toxin-antitoxin system RelE/ParE family toxin [Candidatus Sumerlaeota bacterium]|nr:type II toxin-antitoxin system RelE/ParE family toxin [Candidatus Sumerlaeota bacterium]
MSDYRIFETEELRKRLAKFSPFDAGFIKKKLLSYIYPQLRREPHFGPNIKKLHGYRPETWRYRIGRYRVFYLIDEEERMVFILTADQRKDAYR